jgi:hypothetical protein
MKEKIFPKEGLIKLVELLSLCVMAGITLVSCASKQTPESVFTTGAYLEMNGNKGKFFTKEDYDKADNFIRSYREQNGYPAVEHMENLERTVIPFKMSREMVKNHQYYAMYVPVKINGEDCRLLFDTGADGIGFSRQRFRSIGMTYDETDELYSYFPGETDIGPIRIPYVSCTSEMFSDLGDGTISWLVYAIIADRISIDYQKQQLVLNDTIPDVEPIDCDVSTRHIIIPVEIDGTQCRAVLDTGWWGCSTIVRNERLQVPLDPDSRINMSVSFFWGTITGTGYTHDIQSIKAGTAVIPGDMVDVFSSEFSDDRLVSLFNEMDADILLGSDFFTKCRVTIDYCNSLCWIEPYEN